MVHIDEFFLQSHGSGRYNSLKRMDLCVTRHMMMENAKLLSPVVNRRQTFLPLFDRLKQLRKLTAASIERANCRSFVLAEITCSCVCTLIHYRIKREIF